MDIASALNEPRQTAATIPARVARIIPEAIAKVHAEKFNGSIAFLECTVLDDERTWESGGSEWGSNPPATGLPAARRF
jgi:hypothetical protein